LPLPLLTADTIATVIAAKNHCPLLLPPQPLPLFLLLFSLVMFKILLRPSNILNIFAVAFWLIDVCPHAASALATVACPRHCAFTNLFVVVATCAASTASCMSLMTMGGGAATSAPTKNDNDNEDYRLHVAAVQVGRPCRLILIHRSMQFCNHSPPCQV
jgi:hypothetical protein